MSHCSTGKCSGKSGACDCNCRECFCNYAYDLWQRDIEVRRLQALVDALPKWFRDDVDLHVFVEVKTRGVVIDYGAIADYVAAHLARDLAAKEKEPT